MEKARERLIGRNNLNRECEAILLKLKTGRSLQDKVGGRECIRITKPYSCFHCDKHLCEEGDFQ